MDPIAPEMTTPRLAHGAVTDPPSSEVRSKRHQREVTRPEFIYKRLIDISDYQDAQSMGSIGSVDSSKV